MEVDKEIGCDELNEKILCRILQKCKREAENNSLVHPLQEFLERVSYYTETPINKLQEILLKNQSENLIKPMDFDTIVQVIKFMVKLYSRDHCPTYEILYEHLVYNTELKDIEELKEKLALFGIQNRTLWNSTFLIEDGNSAYERYFYLDKIKKLREKCAHIYYIDERIIDKSLSLKKPWHGMQCPSNESDKYVLFCAISKFGYKNGLCCNPATVEEFQKWIVDILLAQIEPSSVLVFDNSTLHTTQNMKLITMLDTKQDMIKCLEKHNVPYHRQMNKVCLFELIKKFVLIEDSSIDQIIKANGHDVLRLPSNLFHLSPLYHMWEELRISLSNPLLDPAMFDIKDEIHAQILSIPHENFLSYEQSVIEKENQLFTLHTELEAAQDKFISELKL